MSKKKIIIVAIVALIVLAGILSWKLLSTKDYENFEGTWLLKKLDFVDGDKLKGVKNNDKIDIDERELDNYESDYDSESEDVYNLSNYTRIVMQVMDDEKLFHFDRKQTSNEDYDNVGTEENPITFSLHDVKEWKSGTFTISGNSIVFNNNSGEIKSTNPDLIKEKSDFEITDLSDDTYSEDTDYKAKYNKKGIDYLNSIEENKDKKRAFFKDDKLFILERKQDSSGLYTKVMIFEKE